LAAWKAGNLWRYEHYDDDLTVLIAGGEYNTQTTLSVVLGMVMARVKLLSMNYAVFVNPFAMNVGKTDQVHSVWYEDVGRIDPAQ